MTRILLSVLSKLSVLSVLSVLSNGRITLGRLWADAGSSFVLGDAASTLVF